MTGIALQLGVDGGVKIDLTRRYTGVELDLQNAVVSVMTRKGSDAALPGRGTQLSKDIVSGYVHDLNGARHAANFAALEAMRDLNSHSPPPLFSNMVLSPVKIEALSVYLDIAVVDSDGKPVVFSASFQ